MCLCHANPIFSLCSKMPLHFCTKVALTFLCEFQHKVCTETLRTRPPFKSRMNVFISRRGLYPERLSFRGPSVFCDIYTGFCPLHSVHGSMLTVTQYASPFVFIAAPHLAGNHEGWLWLWVASCFSSCTDDVLHPWQLFDATYVHQSKCITSFDCVLL